MVITMPAPSAQPRYERKFCSALTREDVETMIRLHPAMFSEIYHERPVNSLYLDSMNLKHYFDHVHGARNRMKVRIRWYGALFGTIEEPVLELKIKQGFLVTKGLLALRSFVMEQWGALESLATVFNESDLPEALRVGVRTLEPVLLTHYRRKYFQSANRRYRITVDWELQYARVRPGHPVFLRRATDAITTIIELKYAEADGASGDRVASQFPLRLQKNSKYINAVEHLIA